MTMGSRRVRLILPSLSDLNKWGVDYGDVGRHRAEQAFLHRFLYLEFSMKPQIQVEILRTEET